MTDREMTYLATDTGRVLSAAFNEIGMIPVDAQSPALVAQTLACAAVLDDWECARAWPRAFAALVKMLDRLREGVDDD